MMKWLFVAFALLLASPASAQSTVCASPGGKAYVQTAGCAQVASGGFTPSCTASSNFLARATGVTLTADKTNYDTLICGLNTDAVLAKLDALYIFAAPTQATALLNLVQNAFNPTTVGTVSFSAGHGFTGDGSTFVLDSGFNPSTATTPNFTQNSASLGVYVLTSDAGGNLIAMGSDNAVGDYLGLQPGFGNFNCAISTGTANVTATANAQGFWACDRTNSTTVGNSKNGAVPTTGTIASSGVDNVTLTIFARHDGAGATYVGFTSDQFSSAFIGGALTSTDVSNLSSRINTFMTAYGINVF